NGETAVFSPMFMDSNTLDNMPFIDGSAGSAVGHRPGFLYADRRSQQDCADAYNARNMRLRDAWRHGRGLPEREENPPPQTLADAQAQAAIAYNDRNERLRNAWRHRRA